MADDLVKSGMTIQSDPFGFGMTEEERFNVSAPKLAYDILGDSFFKMTKAQRDYVLKLVRSGDLTASEIQQAAEYALPYDPELGRSEQELTYVPPGNDRLFLPEEAKSLRAKEMSEAEFYKTFFNYDYKETEIPQEVREIYAGLMGTSVENTPRTSDNLPRQRIESPTPDSEKRIAMATGGDTSDFPNILGNYGSFSTISPISKSQYLSGPVDFFRETLGTGIKTTEYTPDEEEEEEDQAPDIFRPIGSDDDGRGAEDMSTLALGLDSRGSFDPGNFNSFNHFEMDVNAMNFGDSGLLSSQSGDLVSSFASDFFDNLGSTSKKGFEGFGKVVTGEVSLSDAIASFGQPTMAPGPTGKMRAVAPPAGVMAVAGPAAGVFSALAAIGGAANMAIQKQNAAIFKATGAGFFGEFKGMMVSRKPGSFQYSGNLSGLSQEQMKNLEAIQKGFLPGTMTAETYKDGKWSNVGGTKDIVRTNDVFGLGGTYNANGSWVDLSGQGYGSNTQANLEGFANAINESYFGGTTNVTPEDIKNAQAQVQTEWSFLTGTTVKKGTPTFQEIMQDTIDQKAGTPGVALGAGEEDMTFKDVRDLDRSVADMVKEGVLGKTTGNPDLDKYIEESVARQKAAYAEEQQRMAELARQAEEARKAQEEMRARQRKEAEAAGFTAFGDYSQEGEESMEGFRDDGSRGDRGAGEGTSGGEGSGDFGGGYGGGTDCLTEKMKVKLNGVIDFVTNVKVGDIIDGSVVKEVLHKHMRSGYFIINNELEITNDHPVLANGTWTKPEELYIGDYINDVKVESIKYIDRMTPTVSIVIDGDSFDVYTEGNTYTVHGRYREVRQQAA